MVDISKGDLRKAITTLQSLSSLVDTDEISKTDVIEMSGVRTTSPSPHITPSLPLTPPYLQVVPESKVADLFAACKSKSYLRMNASVSNIINEGYAADQVRQKKKYISLSLSLSLSHTHSLTFTHPLSSF